MGMLVLSRKSGESIIIDGIIKITVTQIRGNKVKIGVAAPDDIKVWREELTQTPEALADTNA